MQLIVDLFLWFSIAFILRLVIYNYIIALRELIQALLETEYGLEMTDPHESSFSKEEDEQAKKKIYNANLKMSEFEGILCLGQVGSPNKIPEATTSLEPIHSLSPIFISSPIKISFESCKILDGCVPLVFQGHWDDVGTASVTNLGHTIMLRLANRPVIPLLSGGPLRDEYKLDHLHFHWSDSENTGSEHVLDETCFSMEIHMVHYNSKYETFQEAHVNKDGLAIIGFFVTATGNTDCPEFQKICEGVDQVESKNANQAVSADCLSFMRMQELEKKYFAYRGSLTHSPYSKTVIWIIFRIPVSVSHNQIHVFRKVILDDICLRPVQPDPDQNSVVYVRSLENESLEIDGDDTS